MSEQQNKKEMTAHEYIDACQELEQYSDQVVHFLLGYTAGKLSADFRAKAIEQARKLYGPREGQR